MKFCLIRLGKDSIDEIVQIDSLRGIQNPRLNLSIKCKQVPIEVGKGTLCFIWLGSDNNKGISTSWNQGLRAFGVILDKQGGPKYNDEWNINFSIVIVFNDSINHHDILQSSSETYSLFSDIPIIGINTHSNQSIQLIKTDEKTQNVYALINAINSIEKKFLSILISEFPELGFNSEENALENLPSDLDIEIEQEDINGSLLMEHPFNPSLINIENKLLNIDLIIKRLNQKTPEIDLYPDFQRRDDLWDVTKQSRLIESILIRFPLPAFYFDGSNQNKWLVVDGLQRLSSIRNFVIKKSLKLKNLEFLTKLEGFGFDDLDRDLQRVIEETQVVAYIINPGTPNDVKFNIFKRINTGGLILESQEIRHALYQGVPALFIAELADIEDFKIATNYSIKTERMLDRDFVNRYLAFYLIGYLNYKPDLETFMSNAMSMVYEMSDNAKQKCKNDFIRSMRTNYKIFGKYAFRKQSGINETRKPINKSLFDVFSVLIANLNDEECQKLITNKKNVVLGLIELLNNDENYFGSVSSSTSEKKRVLYRFSKTQEMLSKILNHNDTIN